MKKIMAGIAFIALTAVGCGGTSTTAARNASKTQASKAKNSEPFQHAEDVKVVSCKLDPNPYLHTAVAKVRITNSSSKPSLYVVTVAFESPDGKTQIDTGTAVANRLLPGQTTTQDAGGTVTIATNTKFRCVASGVNRVSSVG